MGRLKEVIHKGWPRNLIDEQDPLGKIIHELQDVVDEHDATLGTGGDIGANATAIAALQAAATVDEGHITTNTAGIATNTTAIAALVTGARTLPLSFETGEVGTIKLYFPHGSTVTTVRLFVVKALAATDAGTVTLKDSAGNSMAAGVGTVPLSSAFGTEVLITPTDHNSVAGGDFIELITAKTTAGGKLLATVNYTVVP